MSNDNVIFSATDSDNGSKSEVVTVNSFQELVCELESRGELK